MSSYSLTAILIYFLLCVTSSWADESFDGDWAGGFERGQNWVFVQAHFRVTKDRAFGTIDIPLEGVMGAPLAKLELTSFHIRFDTKTHLIFEGNLTSGTISGNVNEGDKKFLFRLDRVANVNLTRLGGNYELATGHFVIIKPLPFNALYSIDCLSGQSRLLFPRSETTFFCGPSCMKPYPVEATIRFTTNELGQPAAIEWRPDRGAPLAGKPVQLREEDVSFANGKTSLAGTLILPPTKGPHPAIVFVHGSGPGSREEERTLAVFFALNGAAGLVYDKRGVGKSSGDWLKSGFVDLADDALAGLELLKQRPDINHHRIGLWGGSQGGWIVGLAASRSTNVGFIISQSGPGITPEEQGAFTVEHRVRALGLSEDAVKEALALYQWNSRCARTGTGWDEYEPAAVAARSKPWYNHDTSPYGRNDQLFWRLIWNYDPIPALQQVHCPVLAFFGELDPLVPVGRSAEIWKTSLAKAENHDVTIKIFPQADHSINDPKTGIQSPEYFTLQREWLLKRTQANP